MLQSGSGVAQQEATSGFQENAESLQTNHVTSYGADMNSAHLESVLFISCNLRWQRNRVVTFLQTGANQVSPVL